MVFEHFPYTNMHDLNLDWIIKKVEGWSVEWAEVKEAYAEFAYDLSSIEAQLDQLQLTADDHTLQIQNLNGLVAQDMNDLHQLKTNLDAAFNTLDNILSNMEGRIEAIETNATFYMYSPFTGQYEPLSQVIMELASFHLEDALTAAEYDALDMTAGYYDGKDLTAIQYDSSGKTLLP